MASAEAPIQALSAEVVVYIFSVVIYSTLPTIAGASAPSSGIASNPEDSSTPITLSHVCSTWRTLALSSPELWSTICITRAGGGHSHLLELWLSRSGERLLDLFVRDGSGWSGASAPHLIRVLNMLCSVSSRWRSFKIEKSRTWWPTEVSTHLARHVPIATLQALQLETLVFELRPAAPYAGFYGQWKKVIASSPKLKRLAVSFMPIQYDDSRVDPPDTDPTLSVVAPWGRLTSLCLTAVSLFAFGSKRKSFLDILSECKNLETLSVSLDDHTPPPKPDFPVVALTKLRTLNAVGRGSLSILMDTLNLPNILYLSVHTETTASSSHNTYSSFSELLSRSNCHLQSFSFRDCGNDATQSLNALLTHPGLSHLSNLRVGSRVDTTTLTEIAYGLEAVPSLTHLTLDSVRLCHPGTESPLVRLALSRRLIEPTTTLPPKNRAALASLHVNFESQADFTHELDSWNSRISQRLGRVDRRYKHTGTGFGTRPFGKELRCGDFSMAFDGHDGHFQRG